MGAPTSSANIEFPAAMIDGEIRKLLQEEGVRFKPQAFGPSLELDSPAYDLDPEIEAGVCHLQNPEARYGEFYDLGEPLVHKGLPIDRTSYMDWNRPPELRVFRPGEPAFNRYFPLDHEAYEPVVSVVKLRELLPLPMHTHEIQAYQEKNFHIYPPLTDWVKERPRHEPAKGTEGQDRESYRDTQDRESYSGDPTNEERAASAMAALESQEKYHDAWPEGLASSIQDLVADLLHLAHQNDI